VSIQTDIFDYAVGLTGLQTVPLLPQENGFAAQVAPSLIGSTYFNRESDQMMNILILGKNKSQIVVADALFTACNNLKSISKYDFGISNVEVTAPPAFVDTDGDFYIWSCIISVKFIN